MIGTDVGNPGEREFQTQTTGRFGKGGGTYRALWQEVEIEVVPLPNFRVEVGAAATLTTSPASPISTTAASSIFRAPRSTCAIACSTARARRSA